MSDDITIILNMDYIDILAFKDITNFDIENLERYLNYQKDNEEYAILLPEDSEDEVVIFKVLYSDNDEAEYIEITDDNLADDIFNEFIKRVNEEE